jgi:uncharacterized membrane protein YsdA (DUF1294 family)
MSGMAIGLASLFVALLCVLAAAGDLPTTVPVLYATASVTAFVLYRIDKTAALAGARRTPEDTLLVAGLLCGWPGALVAQRVLRHKSRKTSFQVMFWTSVGINCVLLAFYWIRMRG